MKFQTEMNRSRERGTSLLGVIVAMSLVLISAIIASSGYKQIVSARKHSSASVAVLEAQEIIVQGIAERIRSFIAASCQVSSGVSLGSIPLGTYADLTLVRSVALAGTFPNTTAGADKARCDSSYVNGMAVGSSLYTCYQVAIPDATANRGDANAFAKNRGAFVEVMTNIKDLRRDSAALCSAMAPGLPGYGIEMYYAIHWVVSGTDGLLYKSRVGSINAAL